MARYHLILAAIFLSTWTSQLHASRILGLFFYNGRSHFVMFEALMKGLAAEGHEVFVVSHFPQKTKLPNYTDLSLDGSLPRLVNNFTVDTVRDFGYLNLFDFMWNTNLEFCKTVLEHPVMKNLMKSDEKFDLIITEIYGIDCCYGFAHKFEVPVIGMVSSVSTTWANDRIGNPYNPSYIPSYFLSYRSYMNFKERLVNTLMYLVSSWGEHIYGHIRTDKLLHEYFGNTLPSLSEMVKNTSLVFVNSHFSINQPRPAVPGFVEVGGLHIPAPQKLPKDLENFLNGATKGVVYVSFGSLVKAETLPVEKLHAFINTFKKLPYHVLWKINGTLLPELPPHIKTSPWIPQRDVLDHPNVRLFIAHGGLMGTQETAYAGVPVLGIPLFADQEQNILSLVHGGMALKLDYDEITEELFSTTVNTMLENPSYRQNAKRISELFRDRPQSAMDTAIYWTEYVIRHKGAPHLRSAAVDLPLYQYLLLDVMAVLFIGVVTISIVIYLVIKKLVQIIFKKSTQTQKPKNKQKLG